MFNNPLRKYQIGGNVSEDQAMQQVVEFISQVAKVSPEEVVTKLDQIKGDENAVKLLSEALELAKNNDERGFQAIQQIFNPQATGKFAKGGKLHDFICKHAKGGYIAGCGCGNVQKGETGISGVGDNRNYTVEVNAPGDTIRTKQYNYRQEIMQTYPDGSVRYTTRTTGGEPTEIHTWGPEGRPSFLRRLWFGNRQANPETVANWRNIIANHPEDPRNVESEQDGGKFQEKNQKATFINFSYPEHNYPPEEAEAYRRQATEAALDATGANDGNGIVLVTVNNEQPMTTPTVFSTSSRNNTPIIGNLDKNSDKLNTLALLNLWKNEQNEEETQNRSDLVYRPFRSSIVDYLKSEGIIKAQEGGVLKAQGGVGKAGKAIMKAAKWVKESNGSRRLIDASGKTIMIEKAPGVSGATKEAAKVLKKRAPYEVAGSTADAIRSNVLLETTDLPWADKIKAYNSALINAGIDPSSVKPLFKRKKK